MWNLNNNKTIEEQRGLFGNRKKMSRKDDKPSNGGRVNMTKVLYIQAWKCHNESHYCAQNKNFCPSLTNKFDVVNVFFKRGRIYFGPHLMVQSLRQGLCGIKNMGPCIHS